MEEGVPSSTFLSFLVFLGFLKSTISSASNYSFIVMIKLYEI